MDSFKSMNFGTPQVNPTPVPEKIKNFRILIDGILKSLVKDSREMSLAYTTLEESRMWLGNVLKEIGIRSPYEQASRDRRDGISNKIPDRSDSAPSSITVPADPIERLDVQRDILEKLSIDLKELYSNICSVFPNYPWAIVNAEEAVKTICLAKNYLGLELGRRRDLYEDALKNPCV